MRIVRSLVAVMLLVLWATPVFATPLTGADTDLDYFAMGSFGSYTEDTTDANDADESGDVLWGSVGSEQEYFGLSQQFSAIYVDIAGTSYAAFGSIDAQYWDGATWSILSVSPNPFGSTGIGYFAFTPPGDWATTSINGSPSLYFINIANGAQGASVSQVSAYVGGGGGAPEFTPIAFMVTLGLGGLFAIQSVSSFSKKEQLA